MPKLDERRAEPWIIRLMCDCGDEMKPAHEARLTYPTQYRHDCPSCAAIDYQPHEYPKVEWRKASL